MSLGIVRTIFTKLRHKKLLVLTILTLLALSLAFTLNISAEENMAVPKTSQISESQKTKWWDLTLSTNPYADFVCSMPWNDSGRCNVGDVLINIGIIIITAGAGALAAKMASTGASVIVKLAAMFSKFKAWKPVATVIKYWKPVSAAVKAWKPVATVIKSGKIVSAAVRAWKPIAWAKGTRPWKILKSSWEKGVLNSVKTGLKGGWNKVATKAVSFGSYTKKGIVKIGQTVRPWIVNNRVLNGLKTAVKKVTGTKPIQWLGRRAEGVGKWVQKWSGKTYNYFYNGGLKNSRVFPYLERMGNIIFPKSRALGMVNVEIARYWTTKGLATYNNKLFNFNEYTYNVFNPNRTALQRIAGAGTWLIDDIMYLEGLKGGAGIFRHLAQNEAKSLMFAVGQKGMGGAARGLWYGSEEIAAVGLRGSLARIGKNLYLPFKYDVVEGMSGAALKTRVLSGEIALEKWAIMTRSQKASAFTMRMLGSMPRTGNMFAMFTLPGAAWGLGFDRANFNTARFFQEYKDSFRMGFFSGPLFEVGTPAFGFLTSRVPLLRTAVNIDEAVMLRGTVLAEGGGMSSIGRFLGMYSIMGVDVGGVRVGKIPFLEYGLMRAPYTLAGTAMDAAAGKNVGGPMEFWTRMNKIDYYDNWGPGTLGDDTSPFSGLITPIRRSVLSGMLPYLIFGSYGGLSHPSAEVMRYEAARTDALIFGKALPEANANTAKAAEYWRITSGELSRNDKALVHKIVFGDQPLTRSTITEHAKLAENIYSGLAVTKSLTEHSATPKTTLETLRDFVYQNTDGSMRVEAVKHTLEKTTAGMLNANGGREIIPRATTRAAEIADRFIEFGSPKISEADLAYLRNVVGENAGKEFTNGIATLSALKGVTIKEMLPFTVVNSAQGIHEQVAKHIIARENALFLNEHLPEGKKLPVPEAGKNSPIMKISERMVHETEIRLTPQERSVIERMAGRDSKGIDNLFKALSLVKSFSDAKTIHEVLPSLLLGTAKGEANALGPEGVRHITDTINARWNNAELPKANTAEKMKANYLLNFHENSGVREHISVRNAEIKDLTSRYKEATGKEASQKTINEIYSALKLLQGTAKIGERPLTFQDVSRQVFDNSFAREHTQTRDIIIEAKQKAFDFRFGQEAKPNLVDARIEHRADSTIISSKDGKTVLSIPEMHRSLTKTTGLGEIITLPDGSTITSKHGGLEYRMQPGTEIKSATAEGMYRIQLRQEHMQETVLKDIFSKNTYKEYLPNGDVRFVGEGKELLIESSQIKMMSVDGKVIHLNDFKQSKIILGEGRLTFDIKEGVLVTPRDGGKIELTLPGESPVAKLVYDAKGKPISIEAKTPEAQQLVEDYNKLAPELAKQSGYKGLKDNQWKVLISMLDSHYRSMNEGSGTATLYGGGTGLGKSSFIEVFEVIARAKSGQYKIVGQAFPGMAHEMQSRIGFGLEKIFEQNGIKVLVFDGEALRNPAEFMRKIGQYQKEGFIVNVRTSWTNLAFLKGEARDARSPGQENYRMAKDAFDLYKKITSESFWNFDEMHMIDQSTNFGGLKLGRESIESHFGKGLLGSSEINLKFLNEFTSKNKDFRFDDFIVKEDRGYRPTNEYFDKFVNHLEKEYGVSASEIKSAYEPGVTSEQRQKILEKIKIGETGVHEVITTFKHTIDCVVETLGTEHGKLSDGTTTRMGKDLFLPEGQLNSSDPYRRTAEEVVEAWREGRNFDVNKLDMSINSMQTEVLEVVSDILNGGGDVSGWTGSPEIIQGMVASGIGMQTKMLSADMNTKFFGVDSWLGTSQLHVITCRPEHAVNRVIGESLGKIGPKENLVIVHEGLRISDATAERNVLQEGRARKLDVIIKMKGENNKFNLYREGLYREGREDIKPVELTDAEMNTYLLEAKKSTLILLGKGHSTGFDMKALETTKWVALCDNQTYLSRFGQALGRMREVNGKLYAENLEVFFLDHGNKEGLINSEGQVSKTKLQSLLLRLEKIEKQNTSYGKMESSLRSGNYKLLNQIIDGTFELQSRAKERGDTVTAEKLGELISALSQARDKANEMSYINTDIRSERAPSVEKLESIALSQQRILRDVILKDAKLMDMLPQEYRDTINHEANKEIQISYGVSEAGRERFYENNYNKLVNDPAFKQDGSEGARKLHQIIEEARESRTEFGKLREIILGDKNLSERMTESQRNLLDKVADIAVKYEKVVNKNNGYLHKSGPASIAEAIDASLKYGDIPIETSGTSRSSEALSQIANQKEFSAHKTTIENMKSELGPEKAYELISSGRRENAIKTLEAYNKITAYNQNAENQDAPIVSTLIKSLGTTYTNYILTTLSEAQYGNLNGITNLAQTNSATTKALIRTVSVDYIADNIPAVTAMADNFGSGAAKFYEAAGEVKINTKQIKAVKTLSNHKGVSLGMLGVFFQFGGNNLDSDNEQVMGNVAQMLETYGPKITGAAVKGGEHAITFFANLDGKGQNKFNDFAGLVGAEGASNLVVEAKTQKLSDGAIKSHINSLTSFANTLIGNDSVNGPELVKKIVNGNGVVALAASSKIQQGIIDFAVNDPTENKDDATQNKWLTKYLVSKLSPKTIVEQRGKIIGLTNELAGDSNPVPSMAGLVFAANSEKTLSYLGGTDLDLITSAIRSDANTNKDYTAENAEKLAENLAEFYTAYYEKTKSTPGTQGITDSKVLIESISKLGPAQAAEQLSLLQEKNRGTISVSDLKQAEDSYQPMHAGTSADNAGLVSPKDAWISALNDAVISVERTWPETIAENTAKGQTAIDAARNMVAQGFLAMHASSAVTPQILSNIMTKNTQDIKNYITSNLENFSAILGLDGADQKNIRESIKSMTVVYGSEWGVVSQVPEEGKSVPIELHIGEIKRDATEDEKLMYTYAAFHEVLIHLIERIKSNSLAGGKYAGQNVITVGTAYAEGFAVGIGPKLLAATLYSETYNSRNPENIYYKALWRMYHETDESFEKEFSAWNPKTKNYEVLLRENTIMLSVYAQESYLGAPVGENYIGANKALKEQLKKSNYDLKAAYRAITSENYVVETVDVGIKDLTPATQKELEQLGTEIYSIINNRLTEQVDKRITYKLLATAARSKDKTLADQAMLLLGDLNNYSPITSELKKYEEVVPGTSPKHTT